MPESDPWLPPFLNLGVTTAVLNLNCMLFTID